MVLQGDVHGLSARDVILPIVPMFHANGWGLAFLAPAVGAKLVMPGENLDPAVLAKTIELEEVTREGLGQVGRGVDHLAGDRGLCAEPSRGGDGGSDRRPPSEVGRAPASHHPAIRGHKRDC